MAIKIQFDGMHTPETPTLVLSKYSGEKLGVIEATSIELSGKFNDASEIHFTVYKEFCHLWDEIRDFRLCWAKEWDKWFQMKVIINDEEATVKNVECRQLGYAELSQVNLHDLQINTEDDIDRDDYNENEPHTFYNERYLENSILYRVMNKVPHYSIKHVDYSVGSLYGVFTFDGVSVLDAFKQLEEEFDCLIVINSGTNEDGTIERSVSVYDLETLCLECGHRGVFTDVCEDCGSTDIKYGYGDDTTIYIDKENLASSVEFTTDNDSVKNCFRLVGGDDLMTDTIIQANPNGSQYLWFVTDEMKEDMSAELVEKIADYDEAYDYYLNDYIMTLPQDLVVQYNDLVTKYLPYNEELISLESNVIGYEKLMDLEYDVIDFELFLQSSFMPSPELMNTTAEQQAALLNRNTMGTVAVSNLDTCSKATASNAVMSVAKAIVDPRYSVKIKTDAYDLTTHIWSGVITVQNYSNNDDKMDSAPLVITVNGDEALFVKQQIFRALDKKIDVTKIDSAYDAKALFALDLLEFKNELKTYGVDSLSAFEQMGQSCLDVMQSYGASIDVDWNRAIYDALYVPYSDKVLAIQEELQLREQEVSIIKRMHDEVVSNKQTIRSALNMESYFGETLWNEFISFCREDDYRNDNYISDGLSNVELFEFARNFIRTAKKELFKSATLQHSISTNLSNLLAMKEFEPIVDYFQLGNWIRVKCDEEIYKLRLISYTINFDNPENIDVEFSDVKSVANGISDIESIIDQASSMSSSYQSIERQASKGDAASKQMTNWFERGLDATLSKIVNNADDQTMVMDDHGLLMREYNPETDEYNNEQLKIINSTIAITDDNWRSTKTAVGKFYYYDFDTGRLKQTFGINGETVVGKLLVGEALGLYNSSATMKFDENGLFITNGTNTFTVNPNNNVLLAIAKGNDSLLSVNDAGNLTVSGDLVANTLATGGRLSSAVGQSGMYIDSDGNVYSGRANEFMVTSEGKLYAKDADIEGTVKATNGTFSGAISSSTYSAGEKTGKDVQKSGLFIDSDGSIYAGTNNQTIIKPDGTFQFGGSNGLTFANNVLSLNGKITATSLSTGTKTGKNVGTGTFIDSEGAIYSGADSINNFTVSKTGVLTATGATIGGSLTATTLSTGGRTSSSKNNSGGTFIDSDGAIYVGIQNKFVVDKDGNMTAVDGSFKGSVNATSLSTGNKTGPNIAGHGTYIDSDGAIYVGSSNSFTVTKTGALSATGATISGNLTATTLSTGGRTSSGTGTNGTYIDSSGNIYIGSSNATKLYASGGFQFGGSEGITYSAGTSKVTFGSNVQLQWSNISDSPEWVNKVSTEITGNTVKTTNLYAADIIGDTIHGKNIYTGGKDGKNSTSTGVHLSSDGYITAGAYSSSLGSNPFEVTPSGNLTAKNADITGDITARSLTLIGDTKIPYGNIDGTPDLDVYIEKDDPVGTVPSDTATSSNSTGFKVSSAGLLTASNARIFGAITAKTLATGTKVSSTSGTGTYIDSNGAIYSGAGSTNNFFVDKEGKFTLGGTHGIRYVSNSNGNYIYIGDGLSIQLSNGNMAIDSGDHLVFNDGLVAYGNIIAGNHSGSGGTMRATGGLFVGTSVDSYVFHANKDGIVYCSNELTCGSVSTTGSISGASLDVGSGNIKGGKITGSSLEVTGNVKCNSITGSISMSSLDVGTSTSNTITCGKLTIGSSTTTSTLITSYGALTTYGNIIASGSSIRAGTYLLAGSSGSNPYVTLDGSNGNITSKGNLTISGTISGATTITASSTITGGSLTSQGGISLSGKIDGATTITASSSITGSSLKLSGKIEGATYITATNRIECGSLKSNGVIILSGTINGATDITASGTVTANKFDGNIVTMAADTRRPIGSSSSSGKYTNVIGTKSSGQLSVEGQFGGSSYTTYTFSTSNSDARLKKDISDTSINGLDIVKNIRHRQFTWKYDGHHDNIGYIAQELECINKGLVYPPEGEDDYYSINTLFLQAVTTKALQELIAEVDALKSRITELERTKGEINESK